MKKFIQEKLLSEKGRIHSKKCEKGWFVKNGYDSEYQEILDRTDFLENPTFPQRIYHIFNDLNSNVLCLNCGKHTPRFINFKQGYSSHCSKKCVAEYTRHARKKTMLERYGEFPFCSKESVEKRKKTCLEKYGVEFPFQNKELQDKQTQTMIRKYGVENPSQIPEFLEKRIETSLKNWGTEHPNQSEEVQERTKKTNLEKYGVEYFFQTEIFKEMSKEFPGSNKSTGELEVVDFLRTITNSEIIQGNKSVLNGKELDILIRDKNLAIEYCGLYWHSNKFRDNTYHKEKLDECEKQGIRLITIFEDEWLNNKEIVKNKLSHILQKNNIKKIFARKCDIVIINNKEKKSFYDRYHIQGDGISSVNIGLYYSEELVACMSFKQRKKGIFELDRYATKYTIVGGFNRLLTYFKNNYTWSEIITFADLRWHLGNVYKQSGFILEKVLKPDYQYYINNKRIHKFNLRKSSMKKKFPNVYDETLTEAENANNIGILKVYDCGKLRYKLINEK